MEELRYISLGFAVLVALALPVFPRLGVVGLVLLFPLLTRFIPRAGPGINASTALFAFALLGGLLHSRPPLPRLKAIAPFVAYYLLALIGYGLFITSTDQPAAATLAVDAFQLVKARLWPTLLFFVGFALAPDRQIRRRLMTCMVIGLLAHSVSGIYDFATGGSGVELQPGEVRGQGSAYRAAGVLDSNPNHLGGHLAAFSILALIGIFDRRSPMWMRSVCAGAYAVSGMVLVLTQSRGAWLGFLVGHIVWLFYSNRKLLLPAAAAATVVVVTAYSASLLPTAMAKRIEETLTPGASLFARGQVAGRFDSSVNARIAIHVTTAEIFADSPVWGHGFASFPALAIKYGGKHGLWGMTVAPESIILNTAVESGIIGLLIYSWLFWTILSPGFVLIRENHEKELGVALIAVFAAIFADSLTQIALFLPEVSLGLWMLAGMAARAVDDRRRLAVAGLE